MPRKGWKVEAVREEVYQALFKRYQEETKDLKFPPKFTRWLNEFLLESLEARTRRR